MYTDQHGENKIQPTLALFPKLLLFALQAGEAFGAEVLCTFLLVVTVFTACDGELGRKNAHTGPLLPLVIGMAVLIGEDDKDLSSVRPVQFDRFCW